MAARNTAPSTAVPSGDSLTVIPSASEESHATPATSAASPDGSGYAGSAPAGESEGCPLGHYDLTEWVGGKNDASS
jgi:hypothetical protein